MGEAVRVRPPPPSFLVTAVVVEEEEVLCRGSVVAVRSVEANGWDEND